jgi:YD repeat-containing protein
MATRKPKIIVSADISESLVVSGSVKKEAKTAIKKAMNTASVVKGNHLTVTTHPDGRTELEWDDAALLEEVRAAINSTKETTNGKSKTTRKKAQ